MAMAFVKYGNVTIMYESVSKSDYATIFLHRASSLKPFSRHLTTDNILDILEVDDKNEAKVNILKLP